MTLYDEIGNAIGELTDLRSSGSKKKIALCIGHNSKAQGAVGDEGISEYNFNVEFLQELIPQLPYHNYKIFERPAISNYTEQQNQMHTEIAEWGSCDIAIEFHFNAAENDQVHGHEILYLSKGGKKLAKLLDTEWDQYLTSNDRGIKQRESGNGYGFLKRGSYKSIIVEPFFASHQHNFIKNGDQREALIRSYIEFFKKL